MLCLLPKRGVDDGEVGEGAAVGAFRAAVRQAADHLAGRVLQAAAAARGVETFHAAARRVVAVCSPAGRAPEPLDRALGRRISLPVKRVVAIVSPRARPTPVTAKATAKTTGMVRGLTARTCIKMCGANGGSGSKITITAMGTVMATGREQASSASRQAWR